MKILKFEGIIAWQKAKELSLKVYKEFSKSRDFGLKSQIERSSVSIMNNIAEGFERQTNKEFRQFLYIAKGSAAETRSMLLLAIELGQVDKKIGQELINLSVETSRLLSGFIKKL